MDRDKTIEAIQLTYVAYGNDPFDHREPHEVAADFAIEQVEPLEKKLADVSQHFGLEWTDEGFQYKPNYVEKIKKAHLQAMVDDQVEPLEAENKRLSEQVRVLTEALEHYADELNWMIGGSQIARPRINNLYTPVNEHMTIQRRNGYDIAQAALTTPTNAETTRDEIDCKISEK